MASTITKIEVRRPFVHQTCALHNVALLSTIT